MFLLRPPRLFRTLFPPHRPSSTFTSALTQSLLRRPFPLLHDYLTPQPSHLLDTTLSSFLPFLSDSITKTPHHLASTTHPSLLPPGHHLIYFPPPTLPSSLLPDGTDTLHSPGPPWKQRLWAGGHVSFLTPVLLDNSRAVIVERISSVRFTSGPENGRENEGEGNGKVFVSIERRLSLVPDENESETSIRSRVRPDRGRSSDQGDSVIIERRDLCFLQAPSRTLPSASPTATRMRRVLKPPQSPEFVHALAPSQILLARFSGLSYNAHLIHLDPEYTRTVYGHRDLLVHGPLLLILMLTCLEQELGKMGSGKAGKGAKVEEAAGIGTEQRWGEGGKGGRERWVIKEISYKNLAPVYVGERIRVCGRSKATTTIAAIEGAVERDEREQGWDVWIEKDAHAIDEGDTGGGGQASLVAKGTVRTQYMNI